MAGWRQAVRRNWAMPASVGLHLVIVGGFLVQFSNAAPSLPADAEMPSLSVEVMLMPTLAPDVVNTAPPPPPPPEPPPPEVVEEPPPLIETVAEAAPPEPPPPPPKIEKRPDPPKPVPVKRPPRPRPEPTPVQAVAEPPPVAAPPSPRVPARPAEQMALAAPMGRAGPPPNYASAIVSHIKRHHRMPRGALRRSQYVVTLVNITIDRQGKIVDYRIVKPSGHPMFDREIEPLMERVNPLPAMPIEMAESQYSFNIPIEFIVR